MVILDWPLTQFWKGQIDTPIHLYGSIYVFTGIKMFESHLMEESLNTPYDKSCKSFWLASEFVHYGLLAPVQGLYKYKY